VLGATETKIVSETFESWIQQALAMRAKRVLLLASLHLSHPTIFIHPGGASCDRRGSRDPRRRSRTVRTTFTAYGSSYDEPLSAPALRHRHSVSFTSKFPNRFSFTTGLSPMPRANTAPSPSARCGNEGCVGFWGRARIPARDHVGPMRPVGPVCHGRSGVAP